MIGNKDKLTIEIDFKKAFFSYAIFELRKRNFPEKLIRKSIMKEFKALELPSDSFETKELMRYVLNELSLSERATEPQKS